MKNATSIRRVHLLFLRVALAMLAIACIGLTNYVYILYGKFHLVDTQLITANKKIGALQSQIKQAQSTNSALQFEREKTANEYGELESKIKALALQLANHPSPKTVLKTKGQTQ